MTTSEALTRHALEVGTLAAAARTTARTGLPVRVVLDRAPGVATQLRLVAEHAGVHVTIELCDTSVIGRFAAAASDA